MKIDEDDLIRLFDKDEITLIPEDTWVEIENRPQKVDVKKATIKIEDERIKKLRRQIKRSPQHKQRKNVEILEGVLKFLIFAGLAGFAVFGFINFPAFLTELKWYYYTDYLGKSFPRPSSTSSPVPTPSKSPVISPVPSPTSSPVQIAPSPVVPKMEGNYIKIDKISVSAPIMWNVEEANIINDLKNGVAHYKGTSLSGDGGNVVLVGHSSNYVWVKSDYNYVFSLLNKLVIGDRIEVRRGTTNYFYDVVSSKVVSPKNVSVLNSVDRETLTLLTCWPIGTNINRLVVEAQLKFSK